MKKILLLLPLLLVGLIQADDYLLIDVRTDGEWDAGHLQSATHIPMQNLLDDIASTATNKDQQIYLYCGSGKRAGRAKTMLENLGYTNAQNIGGLDEASAQLKKAITQD
ncbi:MAG: rhodanese-like domain-containing protein [Proteobacteria bacterium]|mgnify:CR=1 FL=1|jgi:phage shock protein E|nr:rhodanese-like domain-containing protein [Pseudomonadota bacterium]|tara:strand:+ start:54 stop:380 length:327 start_codon:yes stop_codon:yes gene_type:complete